eukprot:scaffold98354_cov35-Tisochrysis_lutea.AAC.4
MVVAGDDAGERVDDNGADQGAKEALHADEEPGRRGRRARHHLLFVDVLERLHEGPRNGERDADKQVGGAGADSRLAVLRLWMAI